MLPGTKGVGTEPTPQCRATDLGDDPLSDPLLADISEREARARQPVAVGKFTCEGFYLHRDVGGEESGRPPRGCSSRAREPGQCKSFAPLAHNLAWGAQSCGDAIVGQALCHQERDFSSIDIAIR
jgi:hypothetical protein